MASKIIEWEGVKIGFMGLVEAEWMQTVLSFPKDVKYIEQEHTGTSMAKELREQGADIIIAVTHSRADNDKFLAKNSEGIDLILGGHDHDYYLHQVNGIPILNSGCNFKQLSLVKTKIEKDKKDYTPPEDKQLSLKEKNWKIEGPRASFEIQRFDITSEIIPDEEMSKIVGAVSETMEILKKKELGSTQSVWDATAETVRTTESAIGNFVADLMRISYNCDFALIQGGGIRSNDLYGPGIITKGDIMKMFPFVDNTVVFEIKGSYFR